MHIELACEMIRSALSNSAAFDRWVISPVWIMKTA